jgi:1,4-alpha-glucan branching enzyme
LHDVLGSQSDSSRNIGEFAQVIADSFPGGGNGAWRVMYTENHDKASGQGSDQGRWPNIVSSSNPTGYMAQKLSMLGVASVLLSPAVPLLFYGQEFLDHQNFVFGNVPNLDWTQVRSDAILLCQQPIALGP